jgi:hypothetical protein
VAGAGDPQAYDRYAYVNNNPIIFIDPTGHIACIDGYNCPDDKLTKPHYIFDSKEIANKILPTLDSQTLREISMNLDCLAFRIDSLAELIVLGHVGVGNRWIDV